MSSMIFFCRIAKPTALDRGGGDAGPDRFCQDKQITGRAFAWCDVAKIDNSVTADHKSFGITNGMPPIIAQPTSAALAIRRAKSKNTLGLTKSAGKPTM